jgi:5-hydroxyisourate hydrolase-like protein (transthyretin family)
MFDYSLRLRSILSVPALRSCIVMLLLVLLVFLAALPASASPSRVEVRLPPQPTVSVAPAASIPQLEAQSMLGVRPFGAIHGRVLGIEQDMTSMAVLALLPDGVEVRRAHIDQSGHYALRNLLHGRYRLQVIDAEGMLVHTRSDIDVTLSPDDLVESTRQDLVLEDAKPRHVASPAAIAPQASGQITGRVTGSDTGQPIAQLDVRLTTLGGGYLDDVTTDSTGGYALSGIASGSYLVYFDAAGTDYQPEWHNSQPSQASATPVVVQDGIATNGIDAVLEPGGTIAGSITLPYDVGAPYRVTITASSAAFATSVELDDTEIMYGFYHISGLPSGRYTVRVVVNSPGDVLIPQYYGQAFDPAAAHPVDVTAPSTTDGIDVTILHGAQITGQVTAAADGTPLADIDVVAYDANGRSVAYGSTDTNGNYVTARWQGLPVGSYRVQFIPNADGASKDYFPRYYNDKPDVTAADLVPVGGPGTIPNVNGALVRAGQIAGRVTAADTGLPLSGVDVTIYGCGNQSVATAITDSDGRYTTAGLSDGVYRVRFQLSPSPYVLQYGNNKPDLASADLVAVSAGHLASVDAALSRGGQISGRITAAETGAGLSGVYAYIYDGAGRFIDSASTDASGAYVSNGLPSGSYRLRFTPASSSAARAYLETYYNNKPTLATADPVSVVGSATVPGINATLARGGQISGRVTTVDGGRATVDVVVFDSTGRSVGSGLAGADGSYITRGLPSGSYRLLFRPIPTVGALSAPYAWIYYANQANLDAAAPVAVSAPILVEGINATIPHGGQISGRVTAADSHQPIDDVSIDIYDSTGRAVTYTFTDATGAYSTIGLPSGQYRLRFSPPGGSAAAACANGYLSEYYNQQSSLATADVISIAAPTSVGQINVELAPAGSSYSITGHIRDSSGIPIAGVAVWAGTTHSSVTDSTGVYSITGLRSASYTLTPFRHGYRFSPLSRVANVPPNIADADFMGVPGAPIDARASTITVTPAAVPADGVTEMTVRITLRDTAGLPVPDRIVFISSERGGFDMITQPTFPTDAQGQTTGTIRSSFTGSTNINAVDISDNIRLATPAAVTFTNLAITPNETLRRQILATDRTTRETVGGLSNEILQAGDDGTYFVDSMDEDAAKLATGIFFGFIEGAANVKTSIDAARPATYFAYPGAATDAGISAIDRLKDIFPHAGEMFDHTIQQGVRTNNWSGLSLTVLKGGMHYYAMDFFEEQVKDQGEEYAANLVEDLMKTPHGLQTMTQHAANAMKDQQQQLQQERDRLLANIPPLDDATQNAYAYDLSRRTLATLMERSAYSSHGILLNSLRGAHATVGHEGLLGAFLRFGASSMAGAAFDGPGKLIVGGLTTSFDAYINTRKLTEAQRGASEAVGVIKGIPEAAARIYSNTVSGYAQIQQNHPTTVVRGHIGAIHNYTQGTGAGPIWFEHNSYSDIEIFNDSDVAATFELFTSFGYNNRIFFGVFPYAYLPLNKSTLVRIGPHSSITTRIYYREEARDGSPTENSTVQFDVVAASDTGDGLFFVDSKWTIWSDPQKVSLSGVSSANLAAAVPLTVIENPISSYVVSDPATQTYQVQIWLANPFESTVTADITQSVPAGFSVIASDGTVSGNQIIWARTIRASDNVSVSFTFRAGATPGTPLQLPAATMAFVEPQTAQTITTSSNSLTLTPLWSMTFDTTVPLGRSGKATTLPITLTNLLDSAQGGNLAITLDGAGVHREITQAFSIAGQATIRTEMSLPAIAPSGLYQITIALKLPDAEPLLLNKVYEVRDGGGALQLYIPLIRL